MKSIFAVLLFAAVFTPALARASAAASPAKAPAVLDDSSCMDCHSDKTLTKTDKKTGKEVSIFVDLVALKASPHKGKSCIACHTDLTAKHPDDGIAPKLVDCTACHKSQTATYEASVHGIALKAGNNSAPTCIDCHGRHDVLPPTNPASALHFSHLAKTCGSCHKQQSQDVQASVHGRAAAIGEREAATCIDCHNDHQIQELKTASAYTISIEVCSKCHASERINAKFGMPDDRVSTFLGSYHGLTTVQGHVTAAANCASCHGYHKVLPSTDPNSSINKAHLVETCGRCHPGATENFAFSRVHTDEMTGKDYGAIATRWVRNIYLTLIFTVVGTLSLHNLLAWLRAAILARRARGPLVMRMSRGQRIQHFILLSSFILLALTGFALKYPDSWLAAVFASDENVRRWLHRGAGVVLIGLGVFHLIYSIVTREGRRLMLDFFPCPKDLKDIRDNLRYFTGRGERAKLARFGYAEKLEYWAVAWGIVIMGVSGLMIWFKMDVTHYLPRWVVEVAIAVHYYEAILACLAIVVWHFYQVIFAPDIYPMNWAWWDGKVPEHWQKEEHPLAPIEPVVKPNPPSPTPPKNDP
jgi:formate dehydrogenase gamma subunit